MTWTVVVDATGPEEKIGKSQPKLDQISGSSKHLHSALPT